MSLIIWTFNIGMFAGVLAVVLFFARRNAQTSQGYGEFATVYARQHWLALTFGLAGLCLWRWLIGAVVFGAALFIGKLFKFVNKDREEWKKRVDANDREWLASLGATHAERAAAINAIFDRKEKTMSISRWRTFTDRNTEGHIKKAFVAFSISRNLAAMETREREMLRIVELLNSAEQGDSPEQRKNPWYKWAKFGLLWGNGKATIDDFLYEMFGKEKGIDDGPTLVSWFASQDNAAVDSAINGVLKKLEESSALVQGDAGKAALLKDINRRLSGGNAWLQPDDLTQSIFAPHGDHPLQIGLLDNGEPLTYSGEGCMITIAPPGSGKTQCNVFPNLLQWRGPAVVLDVKGEIYAGTSRWRQENVGPVYKFSPLDPANSHSYNPLSFIRAETDYIWEDSRFLADMLIVPSGAADPFWENKARDLLTAAIAFVCYMNPPEQRPMAQIVDIVHGGRPFDEMVIGLQSVPDVRSMVQQGNSLGAMNEKTRDSVLQTAQSSLSAWSGERIARVTSRSDWSPLDLRSGANPTLYICLKPSEVESYISLLRVFIAQHIRMLTNELPPRGAAPILFLLDELPRLRQMPPVEEAIEVGRQYGLRLWMFAQSLGQLEKAYPNAEGMVGSCAVRIFMNPSAHDGTAEKISDQLGFREGALDNNRLKVVEATELAGPDYRDYQIVMAASSKPARVRKAFAYQNEDIMARMGSL